MAQAGSNYEKKTGGRKSRWTVPLMLAYFLKAFVSLEDTLVESVQILLIHVKMTEHMEMKTGQVRGATCFAAMHQKGVAKMLAHGRNFKCQNIGMHGKKK